MTRGADARPGATHDHPGVVRACARRLTATPAAESAIARLRAVRGEVTLVQTATRRAEHPLSCIPAREFVIQIGDRLVGEVERCHLYVDADLDDDAGRPVYLLDVADGAPLELTLGPDPQHHFVTRLAS